MQTGFPVAARGQRIGVLGGSFDPPHDGHVQLTKAALVRFDLHQIWWLVTPGNPLKKNGPAPLATRLRAARTIMQHPRVKVTDLEARLGTRYTAQTLAALQARYPQARFVWLMGADNLTGFHRWQNWRGILGAVPVGVVARPGNRISARLSKAARVYQSARIPSRASATLATEPAPRWCFINMPMSSQSSTAIRGRGEWG